MEKNVLSSKPKRQKVPICAFDGQILRGEFATAALSKSLKRNSMFMETDSYKPYKDARNYKQPKEASILDQRLARVESTLDDDRSQLIHPSAYSQIHVQSIVQLEYKQDRDIVIKIHTGRSSGIPVVVNGFEGWMKFADSWFTRSGEDGLNLNAKAMKEDLGDERVPIILRNYNQFQPIDHEETLCHFLEESWGKNNPKHYLHQWQFPLSETVSCKMNAHYSPTPFLGNDLLQHWKPKDGKSTTSGINPYQYLFMGAAGTASKMHQDLGGLAITIAPIVGEKEVTLVHRDDGHCLYDLRASIESPSFERFPLLAFARVWRTVLKPGQILIIPQGTYHACKNITKCLSYSRFHLDETNLPAFVNSFFVKDAPEINHLEILWHAMSDLCKDLQNWLPKREYQRKLSSLLAAFHLVRSLCSKLSPDLSRHNWTDLIREIEEKVINEEQIEKGNQEIQQKEKKKTAQADHELPSNHEKQVVEQEQKETKQTGQRDSSDDELKQLKKLRKRKISLPCSPIQSKGYQQEKSTKILKKEILKSKIPQNGAKCSRGDKVKVKYFKRKLQANVLKVVQHGKGVIIHYEGFPRYHDELKPHEEIFDSRGKPLPWEKVKVNMKVQVPWGCAPKEMFKATVLSKYVGRMIFVYYPRYGSDWNQYLRPEDIL